VLEQVTQILVSRNAKQPRAPGEAGGELEVSQISLSIAGAQSVLFLREVIVTNAGPMQPAERALGRFQIGDIAYGLCQM